MQSRGGMGMKNHGLSEKTGLVADIKVVNDDDDILMISNDGTIIRMAANSVNIYSRYAQGVTLMRMGGDAKVIAMARFKHEASDDDDVPADGEAGDGGGDNAETGKENG
jgi:DNA gyrase subunit A